MRDIKFRAWHKKYKKMYDVSDLHMKTIMNGGLWATVNAKDCIENKDIKIQIQPKDVFLMQYTGLKDCNGKEIYADCDIFKFKYLESLHRPIELIGSFTFNEDDLRYEIDIYKDDKYIVLNYIGNGMFYDFEIIGNIYENPELIK